MAKPEKTEKAPKAEKPARIQQNGVTRPNQGTNTGAVWEIADALSKDSGKPATRKDVLDKAVDKGINVSTAATQYGQWRKFNGLGKEETAPKAVAVKKPVAAEKVEPEVEDPDEEDGLEDEDEDFAE
jgi:hypothetical protein